MKKAIVALALAGFASTAMAAIANSAHDLSRVAGANALSSCQFCHTPHNANVTSSALGTMTFDPGQMPLWNRKAPTASYTYYTLITDNSLTVGAGSFACLGCHDGVSDMGDTYRGTRGFPTSRTMASFASFTYAVVGTSLTDDHPVGVNFTGNGTNGYVAIATVRSNFKLYGTGNDVVECGSCHDPHGTAKVGGDSDHVSGGQSFLRVDANIICSSCHLK